MNIAITGATGFIGQALSMRFAEEGGEHWVTEFGRKPQIEVYPDSKFPLGLLPSTLEEMRNHKYWGQWAFVKYRTTYQQCDLSNEKDCKDKLGEFDLIYHLAANPLTDITKTPIEKLMADNLGATLNILKYCKEGARIVYSSSISVYNNENLKYGASEIHPANPESVYGATKAASEHFIQAYTNMGKIQSCILRFCGVCGKGATHGPIKDLVRKAKEDDIVEIIGSPPGTIKCYLHISDAVEALMKFGLNPIQGIYNICNTDIISIEQIVDKIYNKLNCNKQKKWTNQLWAGDCRIAKATNGIAYKDMLYWPKLSSEQAIDLAIDEIIKS